MNKFLNFFTAILFLSTAILISCGGSSDDPAPVDAVDQQGALVAAGAVTPTSVTQGTTEVTSDWSNFSLTFTYNSETNSGTFNTSGRPADSGDIVWPASGTWTFGGTNGDNTAQIVRSDNVTMDLSVNATAMTLSFTVVDPNGRILTFGGDYVFALAF